MTHTFWVVLTYVILVDRCIDDITIKILIYYHINLIDSMLWCVCTVTDHKRHENGVRTSVTQSAAPCVPLFCSYCILMSSAIYYCR